MGVNVLKSGKLLMLKHIIHVMLICPVGRVLKNFPKDFLGTRLGKMIAPRGVFLKVLLINLLNSFLLIFKLKIFTAMKVKLS